MTTALWIPQNPSASNMWQFMLRAADQYQIEISNYQQLYAWSVQHPELFWQLLCEYFNINFSTPAIAVLNEYEHMRDAQWFSGARFNFAQELLRRTDDKIAIININEKGRSKTLSYKQLALQVYSCAAALKQVGVVCGDRVCAILPNSSYAIIAMLASAAIGAIWSSCSPDFGVQTIVDRFAQVRPKILFTSDMHSYNGKLYNDLDKFTQIRTLLPSLVQVIICPGGEITHTDVQHACYWDNFLIPANTLEFIQLPFSHPLYIMFSSGTTGAPKCIVHGAGGTLLQHLKELGLHVDLSAQDNLCFYTNCGWMMWNWMVSALSLGVTLTLYDGAPLFPHAGRMFELIDAENITVFGTSAQFISAVLHAKLKPLQIYNLKSLRCILSTGSPLLPQHYDFVYQDIKSELQLSSISGGTDIISCFALSNPLLPVYRGEMQCIGLGMDLAIFDKKGQALSHGRGELVCTKAFPSMPVYFWNDFDSSLYTKSYFTKYPHVWAHGDLAELTDNGGLIIYGRSDTSLNPGGVRIGTAEIYNQLIQIAEISESVVIAQCWQDDERIILFVVLRAGLSLDEILMAKISNTIRLNTSARHVPAKIIQVAEIPHTHNAKIVELAVRQTVAGEPVNNLAALTNPWALDYFKDLEVLRY